MGLNPQEVDNVIEVPIPKMTKEVRENMIKVAKKSAEAIKERVRSVRRDAMQKIKKMKNEGISEDDVHRMEKEVSVALVSIIMNIVANCDR